MRVTKYGQSCLVVETDGGARLLLDPGTVASARTDLAAIGSLDAVLVTHEHPDHLDPAAVEELLASGVPVHTNASSRALLPADADVHVVAGGDRFTAGDIEVAAYDAPHMPMVDGSPGPPNLAFVLDGRLLHPGDAREVAGIRASVAAVPIAGPSTSCHHAELLARSVGADTVVPIHYDVFPEDPALFARMSSLDRVLVLSDGETVDL